jgi:hypothetical protein
VVEKSAVLGERALELPDEEVARARVAVERERERGLAVAARHELARGDVDEALADLGVRVEADARAVRLSSRDDERVAHVAKAVLAQQQ